MREGMNRAAKLDGKRRNTVGFALTVLQRRLASSPEAILRSLERRAGRLERRAAHETSRLWINNGSVYVSRWDTVESGSLASDDLCGFTMPPERSLDVNASLDLAFARFLGRGE